MNARMKHREIQFEARHPDAHQAQTAMLLAKLKQALYRYTAQTQRANLGISRKP